MTASHRLTADLIHTEAQLRALIGEPAALTCTKITDRLNAVTRLYVERSPFVCLGAWAAEGVARVEPGKGAGKA